MSYMDDVLAQANAMSPLERFNYAARGDASTYGMTGQYDTPNNSEWITTGDSGYWTPNTATSFADQTPTLGNMFGFNGAVNTGNTGTTGMEQSPFGYQTMYGLALNGSLPTQQIQGAPVYSSAGIQNGNISSMDPALWTTLNAGNRGAFSQGVNAFLGGGWTPYEYGTHDNERTITRNNSQQLWNLAAATGFDTSRYGRNEIGTNKLYEDMNDYLKNYYGVAGLASGWNGNSDPLSSSRTLYMDNGQGNLIPVSSNQNYRSSTSSEINRAQTGEMLTALSMVLPAFGGAAGMLGSGASGTLSAGSGLGLTNTLASTIGTGATNALVNAGTNYLLSGGQGGLQGIAGSLLGSLGSAAGNSILGNANGLGSLFSTAGAGSLGSVYNSMGGLNQILNTTGLGGELGNVAGLMSGLGGGGITAQNLQNIMAQMAGRYAANQIDPRLQGLGGQAGSSLASLFNR